MVHSHEQPPTRGPARIAPEHHVAFRSGPLTQIDPGGGWKTGEAAPEYKLLNPTMTRENGRRGGATGPAPCNNLFNQATPWVDTPVAMDSIDTWSPWCAEPLPMARFQIGVCFWLSTPCQPPTASSSLASPLARVRPPRSCLQCSVAIRHGPCPSNQEPLTFCAMPAKTLRGSALGGHR